jgi:dual specificity phosphatase 12
MTDPLPPAYYSCRRCRCFLFSPSDVGSHAVGSHAFSYRRAAKSGGVAPARAAGAEGSPAEAPSPCTSFFLSDALPWMSGASRDVSNKLACPGCGARLGDLSWAGSQCSCGTWVTPAIQLQKKAVELRGAAAAAPLAGLPGCGGGGGGGGGGAPAAAEAPLGYAPAAGAPPGAPVAEVPVGAPGKAPLLER